MGFIIRSSCFGCLLLALILQGAVCRDDRCQTLVSIAVTIGQNRSIHCNVSCRNPEWGQQGSDGRISQGPNYVIQDVRNTSIGGTVYWCRCPGGDQNRQCFKILVNPHIFEFIAEPSEVTVGSAFDLICKAEGYPAPQPQNFHLGTVEHVPNIHVPEMYHPVPSGVDVTVPNVTMEYMGNYSCVVIVGTELHTTSTTARVTVYEPPKLSGIKNFTMSNAVSNQSAVLECMIESTPSSEVVLEWRRNGILLSSSWKYVDWTLYSGDGSNLLVAILVVRDVSNGDLGAYECRLYSNYSYLRNRPEDVMEAWIMADAPNIPTTGGIMECDCDRQCEGAVVAAVINAMVVFILVIVIAIIIGVTLCRKWKEAVRPAPTQNECGLVPNQLANLYVNAPVLPPDTVAQEMDDVQAPAELAHDEQERNHVNTVLHSTPDEDHTPPAGAHPEHEAAQVPPTGEVQIQPPVQPAHDVQERAAIPPTPPEDHTPPSANTREPTTNNQLSGRVGDGPHTPDSDSPTLDTEKHPVHVLKHDSARRHHSLPDNALSMSWPGESARFLFGEKQQAQAAVSAAKLRRGSRSSRDSGVHKRSKPPPSPLAHTPPKSAIKKRRISTSSIPYKRQSQAEDGEGTMLLELPETPKSSSPSSSRQHKDRDDEETKLLKEHSPVDDEHLTISDGHTSDDP